MTNPTSPNSTFLLHTLPIFTGTTLLPPSHILITDGIITLIGPGPPPASLLTSDIPVYKAPEGYMLIPGLIDAHIHGDGGNTASLEQSLRFGVTTVLDMHNEKGNCEKLMGVCILLSFWSFFFLFGLSYFFFWCTWGNLADI